MNLTGQFFLVCSPGLLVIEDGSNFVLKFRNCLLRKLFNIHQLMQIGIRSIESKFLFGGGRQGLVDGLG